MTTTLDAPLRDDVTIIIPQYGQAELTCECIRSIRQHEGSNPAIVVVDDGSDTNSRTLVDRQCFANTHLIESPHRGVTAAWNIGAAAAETRYLVFLNNDVITHGIWLTRLIGALGSTPQSDVPNPPAIPLLAGVRWREERSLVQPLKTNLYANRFLEGWCLVIRRETFNDIGGFDESMAYYWSDTDLQLRLLQRANFQDGALVSVPDLPLRHLGHRTAHDTVRFPQRRQQWRADREAFLAKWKPTD